MKDANFDYLPEAPERKETVDLDRAGVTVIDGAVFSHTADGCLRMDCMFDEEIPGKKPAIIWIHGGGFTEKHLTRKSRPERRFLELIKRGYFIASIDYRLSQVRPFPSQIQDCKCAVRYLRANAGRLGIDPNRIGVWGESCGGQLAALMSVQEGIPAFENVGGWEDVPSTVQAAVSWYGALDVMAFHNSRMEIDADYPARFEIMYGGKPADTLALLESANPMHYAGKPICPLLAMCSDADPRISHTVNTDFCESAKKIGCHAEFVTVPNQGHGYFTGKAYDDILYNFFDTYLKG